MKIKGQLEFVAVGGLVLLVIIAIFLLLNPKAPTGNMDIPWLIDEQKTIVDSVNNFMKTAARSAVTDVYNQGGYADIYNVNTIKAGGSEIAVWSECNSLSIPDMEKEIGLSIKRYIANNLKSQMFYGRNVTFDLNELKADVKITKGKILAKIELPAEASKYNIPKDYAVEMESDLFDIMKFAEDFTKEENETKFFGTIVMLSMLSTNPDSANWTPVSDTRTGCFEPPLVKTERETMQGVDAAISYAISHITWREDGLRFASNPFYPLRTVKGKAYDLDVSFSYPEWDIESHFSMSPKIFSSIPKPLLFKGAPFPIPRICYDTYSVKYTFKFPVIVAINDEKMNQWFQFAIMSDITENVPGGCVKDEGSPPSSDYEVLCSEKAECSLTVNVMDTYGNLMGDVEVFFDKCYLGKTDSWGRVKANIPCMIGELSAYKDGYENYASLIAAKRSSAVDVFMRKRVKDLKIAFFGVPVTAMGKKDAGEYEKYIVFDKPYLIEKFIKEINPSGSGTPDIFASATFDIKPSNPFSGEELSFVADNSKIDGSLASVVTMETVAQGEYEINGFAKRVSENKIRGFIESNIQIKENTESICLYFPLAIFQNTIPYTITDELTPSEKSKMIEALKNAGIDPVVENCDLSLLPQGSPPQGTFCGDYIVETPNAAGENEECDFGSDNSCCQDCKWTCPPYRTKALSFKGIAEKLVESGDVVQITGIPACRKGSDKSIKIDAELVINPIKTAVVFTTDTSGSMLFSLKDVKDSLKENLANLYDASQAGAIIYVGLVDFSDKINSYPLGNINTEIVRLQAEIDKYKTDPLSQGTYTKEGVEEAYNMLKNFDAQKKIMVILTDGSPTSGHEPDNVVASAKSDGIEIYTVALVGNRPDAEQLKNTVCSWSSETACATCISQNKCKYAKSATSASRIFDSITDEIIERPRGELTFEIEGKKSIIQAEGSLVDIVLDLSGIECKGSVQNIDMAVSFNGGGKLKLLNPRASFCPPCDL